MPAARLQDWFYRNVWAPREIREGVNLENPRVPINGWTLNEVLGGATSSGGRTVSYNTANTLSAFWRGTQIKGGVLSSIPFQVFKKTDKGRVQVKPSEHPVARMFASKMNEKYTKQVYFERSIEHLEGWGNHIGVITFSGLGLPEKIDLVHPKDVECYETDTKVAYKIKGEAISADRVIHVPNKGQSLWGLSTISAAREDFGFALDTRDYGVTTMSKGGVPVGLFIPQQRVTDIQREELQNNWKKSKASNKAIAIPFGWEYKQLSLNPADVAFIESRQFEISDIARWTGVPPHKLFDMGRATWNNVESVGIEFLTDTMTPICAKYEGEYTTKLFTMPGEIEAGFYAEYNIDAYLRADSIAKAEAYSKYVQNAIKTPNEIRKYNNDPSMPDGDDLFMQSGTLPISLIKQVALTKPAPTARIKKEDIVLALNGNGKH